MKKIYLLLSAALLLNIGAFGQNVNALFNKISNDVMNKYAPDERDKTYDVSLIEKDGKLMLVGSTTEKEAVEALVSRLADAGITAQNRIDLLPSNSLKGKTYGIVCMSTASFNCDGRFSGESGTQALMGTPVKVHYLDGYWVNIETPDGYKAWVNDMAIVPIDQPKYGL